MNGGKVFFTDLNEENGTKIKKELQQEFGADRVEFSVQNVTDAENWVKVRNKSKNCHFVQASILLI